MIHSPTIIKTTGMLCALFLFVACNEEEYKKVQAETAVLNDELREAKDERNALNLKARELKSLIFNSEKFQKKEREMKAELNEVAEYHRDLKAAYGYTSGLADKWKVATRKSLVGEQLGLVRLVDKTLTGAVIVELDAEKVVLKHASGEEVVELAKMPEELRKKLIHEATILLESEIAN